MDTFYIVWCPTRTNPPSHRHASFDAAKREAEGLAETAPRAEFFVLAAMTRSQKVAVVTESLRGALPEIPF